MLFFFFNDTATTEIYTLSLHDALPISGNDGAALDVWQIRERLLQQADGLGIIVIAHHRRAEDRKSTRLNSSHLVISYAVFCLKKKKRSHRPNDQHLRILRSLPRARSRS